MAPFNSCVFFPDPPLFIVKKIMAPTEYFPDNLEENVNVKMVLIVGKARFAMVICLSILHSSVLKMRPTICKIFLRHFHKFGQASTCNCNFLPCTITHAEKTVKRLFDIHLFHFKLFISSSNLNKYV